jgi:hypothetical protein
MTWRDVSTSSPHHLLPAFMSRAADTGILGGGHRFREVPLPGGVSR